MPPLVRHIVLLLSCVALLAIGCGEVSSGAADFTCGQMRASGGRFREQARLMVDREGLQARALTAGEAILDVELQIRRTCRGAADDYKPYRAALRALPPRSVLDVIPGS
jgi:hypothetical protein